MRSLIILSVFLCALTTATANSDAPETTEKKTTLLRPSPILVDSGSNIAPILPQGQITERIVSRIDPAQSYALYLPSAYTAQKKWPILYCFDPVARGSVPVERFREAAEKYGWIVVGSNNSKNGSWQPSLDAAAAMWEDTYARFSIDDRRVYTAGFSGGARVAIRFGYLCRDCLAGVIACGAGFPVDIAPSAATPFSLFGVAGTDDFNFPEMKRLAESLARFSVAHRLAIFDGGHHWPPAAICAEAVEWMELQAIKTGRRGRDEALVEELWRKRKQAAQEAEAAKNLYEAYRHYLAGAIDFRGLRAAAADFERRATELKATGEVKRELNEEGGQIRRQQRHTAELLDLLRQSQDPEQRAIAFASFRRSVADLKKSARGAEDSGARRTARRTLNDVFAQLYEEASNLLRRGENYSRAAAMLEVVVEIAPENPQIFYDLACAHAGNKDKRKALDALKKAVEKGYANLTDLRGNALFGSLRGEAAYQKIVESLSQKQ